ncbi:MAG: aminotransferase class V-fold PLP-dependent enzyme [Thiohalomonadaceae bacterium]
MDSSFCAADEFPLDPGLAYLNHAAVAPWPRRARDAVQQFAEENCRFGARDYPRWMAVEARLREHLRTLLGAASSDDIALVKNTSEGLSFVAQGLPWQPGDNIVTTAQEFPSNRIVWESLRPQGVEVRLADVSGPDPEAALLTLADGHTRLLAVSAVQYASGLRMDLERLGRACRQRGILFVVDAIQSLGVVPMDVEAFAIDFLAADGHKWLCGPEGIGVFWCHPALRERLRLFEYGWHMVEHLGDYERRDWAPAASARRFECGSPNMLGIHGLEASVSLLLEVGIPRIKARVAERVDAIVERCRGEGWTLLSPEAADRRAGIVTLRRPDLPPAALFEQLRAEGVVCALRGGGVRLSPHFYTPPEVITKALNAIANSRREV